VQPRQRHQDGARRRQVIEPGAEFDPVDEDDEE